MQELRRTPRSEVRPHKQKKTILGSSTPLSVEVQRASADRERRLDHKPSGRRNRAPSMQTPRTQAWPKETLCQERGGKPDWLFQRPRNDSCNLEGERTWEKESSVRVHRQHCDLAGRLRGKGGDGMHRPHPEGKGCGWENASGHYARS